MAKIAYIRVSSITQNTARQEEMFKDLDIDKYFIEKVSGQNIKDRVELQKMMDYVREAIPSSLKASPGLVDRCQIF